MYHRTVPYRNQPEASKQHLSIDDRSDGPTIRYDTMRLYMNRIELNRIESN
jgi:hypothetical protein